MDSMYMRSPTTPTARKVPATPTPSKARATTSSQKRKTKAQSESSPTPGQKRKMKNEVGQEMNQYLKILTNWKVSPKNATPKGKGAGARSQPGKKQKVAYKENETGGQQFSPIHNDPRLSLPTPYTTPNIPSLSYSGFPQQQQQQYMAFSPRSNGPNGFNGHYGSLNTPDSVNLPQMASSPQIKTTATAQPPLSAEQLDKPDLPAFQIVVNFMFTQNSSFLPQSKEADVVKSCDLDTYAYVLWDWCLRNKNGQLHAYANRYGAMIAEHKLRILACLNLLPSWFFLRSQILTWLQNQGWTIDDSDMHAQAADVTPHIQEIISRQHRSAILAQQNQRNQQSQEAQEAQQGMGN
ncbi:hypothetical protein HBH98_038720 [Parastagonospora nodorum]|uniref:Uncharacterized protein n=1 Tax=Phaeosphaeria nodorum (strain SN15 / ATCC MYA-4574 / FGSC 10173) TaxID=321614 RepID=A0A7U2F5R8_PHANO|nr:hypothetical protein HBH54_051880 [Parastagonospora nodorum]QRC99257.1 hypothetical protein JI435_065870 [Parastagonospora nodorum SN15]KAH3985290.1 hypothetical protein HBH52_050720 [Parastagonospora nodorum]KAH4006205.1 hypothetical protein HBI10_022880 [Parastagonospora nodorum]KAH4011967.1 hypothetical protein HBI13_193240 [Parastagonospora nodorum]